MKTMYVCEKCGKTHDSWDAAYKCENAHSDLDTLYRWDFAQDDSFQLTQYKDADSVPTLVYLKSRVLDADGCPVTDLDGCPVYRVYPFKRLAHDGMCDAMEESMRKRWHDDHPADTEN